MNDATNKAGQLGTIISWRVPNEVDLSVLHTALREAGFDPGLAPDLHATHALARALGEMRKGRVIRKLRRDGDNLYFQLTAEYLDEREISYEKEAEVCLEIPTAKVTCPESEAIADAAQDLLRQHQAKRLTSDLSRLLQRIYSKYGADLIPIREQGGAYFVPEMHAELVQKTRTLLRGIGGNVRGFDVRLGSEETQASVAEAMADYLIQSITEFEAACENLHNKSRKDVIENRVATVGDLRRKLEMYAGLLGGYAETIKAKLEAADAEMIRRMTQDSGSEAKAA